MALPLAAVVCGSLALLGLAVKHRALQRTIRQRSRELSTLSARQQAQADILAQVTDAIVTTDSQMRVTSWNSGAGTLFGIPEHQALGQFVGTLITDRMASPRGGDLHGAIDSGTDWHGDAEIVRPFGDTRFVDATVRMTRDAGGGRSGAVILARDVDARRRAEIDAGIRARQHAVVASLGQRALAGIDFVLLMDQAMSLASNTLEVSATGVFQLAEDRRSLTLRAGAGWGGDVEPDLRIPADLNSYPSCALVSEASAITLDHQNPHCPQVDAFHIREGITAGAAIAIPGRTGPYGLLLAADRRGRRFSRDDVHFLQAIANVIGAAFERSVIDADLRSELALHDATLEAAADGILVTDAEGFVRRYNQRLVDMWRHPPEVLARPKFEDWVVWCAEQCEDPEIRLADFRAALNSDEPQMTTVRLLDGRVIERHSHPQRVDGTIDGRVWCYRDVTERLRAEEERRRLEAQMQHVQKLESLGVLAGGIAHDFNNLLVGMLGYAGLALQELDPDHPVHDSVVQIQTTAQRAAELTNQMLAYSGRGRFVLQSTSLSNVVGEMTNLLRTAVARNAEIVLDLHDDLPAFDGDPAQIRQVIMNLITNASDAIGSAPGRIMVSTGRMQVTRAYVADAWVGSDVVEGEFVFAEVTDTGCGMDSATLSRIFDPFFTTKFTGRGLGLAAVLGIVRGHHGAIKISSATGRGTTFRVLLPAARAAVVIPEPVPAAPPAASVANVRVLVVDDEAGVRAIARESLKRAGFQVTTANDGVEALDVLREDPSFDAVLLDMTMPHMSGVEALRLIKQRQPALPVVLTSGYSAQEAVGRVGSDGLAGFIQKPFMPMALVQTMLDAIGQGRRVA